MQRAHRQSEEERSHAWCAGLPLQEKPEALLAETLFGQMLNLPRPRKKAVAYCMLMVGPAKQCCARLAVCCVLQPLPSTWCHQASCVGC